MQQVISTVTDSMSKTLCFKTLVSSLESGYEYFWVLGSTKTEREVEKFSVEKPVPWQG